MFIRVYFSFNVSLFQGAFSRFQISQKDIHTASFKKKKQVFFSSCKYPEGIMLHAKFSSSNQLNSQAGLNIKTTNKFVTC